MVARVDFGWILQASAGSSSMTIDGGTVSGKSTLAAEIAAELSPARPVVTVSFDAFMRPRRQREKLYVLLASGQITPQEYHDATWDLPRLDEFLIDVIRAVSKPAETTLVLPQIVGRDRTGGPEEVRLRAGVFVVLEGTGALLPERPQLDGPKVWCEGPNLETAIQRKLHRLSARSTPLTPQAVADRYFSAELVHDRWVESISTQRADALYKPAGRGADQ